MFFFVSHSPHLLQKESDVVFVNFGGSLGRLCSSLICLCVQTDRVQADTISIEVPNSMCCNLSKQGGFSCKSTCISETFERTFFSGFRLIEDVTLRDIPMYLSLMMSMCMLQVGSIEGRVAVQHIDEAQQSKNFTFKCHRDNNDIYAVNSIDFHPVCSSLFTMLLLQFKFGLACTLCISLLLFSSL